VVPASFYGYFTAAGAAAGVLIGLLFVAYLYQLVIGILLLVRTGYGQDFNVAYLQIGFFAIALRRAWSLVQGKHLSPASRDTPAAAGDLGQYGDAGS